LQSILALSCIKSFFGGNEETLDSEENPDSCSLSPVFGQNWLLPSYLGFPQPMMEDEQCGVWYVL
jgi:hypothetical protein